MKTALKRCINIQDIGKFVREARLYRLLSQEELALLAGVTQSTISFLENDTHSTSLKTIVQIISALNLYAEVTFHDKN